MDYWNPGDRPVIWSKAAEPAVSSYTYTISGGNAVITDMDTTLSGEVIIPAALDGCTVTEIGAEAFSGCQGITGVIIPEGVTTIGDYAFRSCYNLASVSIPLSVTTIGSGAFWDCEDIETVYISANVTYIGNGAFAACSGLKSIDVDEANPFYSSIDGVLYSKDGRTLIMYPRNKSGSSFDIPAYVSAVGERAFWFSRRLTSVSVPASVVSIGDYAFGGCERLESVSVDDANPAFRSIDGVLYSKDGCTLIQYPCGSGERNFVVPDRVTCIESSAFYACELLESIVIHDRVSHIGSQTFTRCNDVTIYAEAASQPAGWNEEWNYDNRPVIWGYGAEE